MSIASQTTDHAAQPSDNAGARATPSLALFSAALAGLLGAPLTGCDSEDATPETCEKDAGEVTSWEEAGSEEDASAEEEDAATEADANSGTGEDATVDAGASSPFEVLSEVEGDVAFAKLKSDCDTRGGYMQVHASCSGSNDCAGFSYGDWDPGVLTEHTCAAANGCVGASCVVLPKDSGKTPEEILFAEELPVGGPQPCWFCHAESQHQPDGSYTKDMTKFKVWVPAGSTRTEQNWLELSPEEQEVIVAFGRVGVIQANGQLVTQRSMKGYHKLYSRAEIQRVVQHLRKMIPIVKVITAPK